MAYTIYQRLHNYEKAQMAQNNLIKSWTNQLGIPNHLTNLTKAQMKRLRQHQKYQRQQRRLKLKAQRISRREANL